MQLLDGTYIVGKCLGTKRTEHKNASGEIYFKHFVGLEMPVKNGYDGQAIVVDVQFSKDSVQANDMNRVQRHVGNQIAMPVNSMSRAYKDKAYTTNYFDTSRDVVSLSEEKPLPKAVNG